MISKMIGGVLAGVLGFVGVFAMVSPVEAAHVWGGYHWARTTDSFALQLGDNVNSSWDSYLSSASLDWTASAVLDTSTVAGKANPRTCRPISGRVEVCNSLYGSTGWLGIAQVWVSGGHITQGVVKLNDSYFRTATYNKPEWKQFVMCQEIGHTFGLNHQDEIFANANLGTCMDYTNDPSGEIHGQLSNLHPNQHDFDQLATLYTHHDTSTTVRATSFGARASDDIGEIVRDGVVVKRDRAGRPERIVQGNGRGEQIYTFIIWADEESHDQE